MATETFDKSKTWMAGLQPGPAMPIRRSRYQPRAASARFVGQSYYDRETRALHPLPSVVPAKRAKRAQSRDPVVAELARGCGVLGPGSRFARPGRQQCF